MLVVEDDEDIADVLRRSLRRRATRYDTSGDGVEALDLAAGFVPDFVVLDLGLPRLDGSRSVGACAPTATCRS